jgi:hypothetical protein
MRISSSWARLEPLLVEQLDHFLDSVAAHALERISREEVPAPGLAGLLGAHRPVLAGRQCSREDGRQQPVLVRPVLGRLGLERVEGARAARPGPCRGRRADEAGVGEDAQVPAHGVRVQPHAIRELGRVEAALGRA